MVITNTDLKFLLADDILFWPISVVFPSLHHSIIHPKDKRQHVSTHLVISLDSMILFSSLTTKGPTHTKNGHRPSATR